MVDWFDQYTHFIVLCALLVTVILVEVYLVDREWTWVGFNNWLKNLASTNFRILIGALMALGTGVFYFGSELRCIFYIREGNCRPIDTTNFGLWLAFVAAWAGISYKQYAKKRDTFKNPSPDSTGASRQPDPEGKGP